MFVPMKKNAMSHVTHMKESCHAHEGVMAHTCKKNQHDCAHEEDSMAQGSAAHLESDCCARLLQDQAYQVEGEKKRKKYQIEREKEKINESKEKKTETE